MQKLQRSRLDSSRKASSINEPSQSRFDKIYLDSSRFTEVSFQTKDEDVPYIAIYKPNFNRQKQRIQAASKLAYLLKNSQQTKIVYGLSKLLALGPKEKLFSMKTLYLGSQLSKIIGKAKEKAWKSVVVHRIKASSFLLGAKIISKVHNGAFIRNMKNSLIELRRNRLLMQVRQLSNEQEQAKQLNSLRTELFRSKEEAFSQQFIASSVAIQVVSNYQSLLSTISETNYAQVLKTQIKRFEQSRFNSTPRIKDLFNNETVAATISNIILAFQKTAKDYEQYCDSLQVELATYKDAEGINELKEVIQQKDKTIKQYQSFAAEMSKMDIELKKYTAQNKFMAEKAASLITVQDKKLQAKGKEGTIAKLAASRSYLTGIASSLMKRTQEVQSQQQQAETARREFERSTNQELKRWQSQFERLNNELNQEKTKFSQLLEKKQNKKGLQELKRRWKDNEEGKNVVQYILDLQTTISKLEKNQKQTISQQTKYSEEISYLQTFVGQCFDNIRQNLPPVQPKKISNFYPNISQALTSIFNALDFAYEQLKYQQVASKMPEPIIQERQQGSKVEDSKSRQLEMADALFSQLKMTEEELMKAQVQSKGAILAQIKKEASSITAELKSTFASLEKQLKSKTNNSLSKEQISTCLLRIEELIQLLNQSEKITAQLSARNSDLSANLKSMESKIEELKSSYQEQIKDIQSQLKESNKNLRKTIKGEKEGNGQALSMGPLLEKNDELLSKHMQLQEEILSLKTQNESNFSLHQQEMVQWKAENTGLWAKVLELESLIAKKDSELKAQALLSASEKGKHSTNQNDKALFDEMKERFSELQKAVLNQKDFAAVDYDKAISNALCRIDELMNSLRQSQLKVTELSLINSQLALKLEQNHSNKSLNVDQTAQLFKQKNRQLQEELNRAKAQFLAESTSYRQEIQTYRRYKEQAALSKQKISDLQNLLEKKNIEAQKSDNRLKQVENLLVVERDKSSSFQSEVARLQKQLERSHFETQKLAGEAREQIKKITMVIRSLESELDKKTKDYDLLQQQENDSQRTINKLQRQNKKLQQQIREAVDHNQQLEENNSRINAELTHLKAEFYSIQVELQTDRTSKLQNNDRYLSLQNEIKDKQQTITNILQRSKAASDSLNQQLFETRQQILSQQKKFEEQMSVKNALINRLEHRIIQLESNSRLAEQTFSALEKSPPKFETEPSLDRKDRQIALLQQQIASLQQFLGDLSHQYKQLQAKYHQEKHRFGRFYDNSKQELSMQEIDKAIQSLGDNSELSEEVKSLIVNNEHLQVSIEELEAERRNLLEKARSLPEREYVVELLFNIILGAKNLSPQSQKGSAVWNELIQINQKYSEVGELFTELQKFSLRLLSLAS